MLLVPVVSSDIAAIGYDPTLGELQIQFVKGTIYSYDGIPPAVYDAFVMAPSKGSFFARVIKRFYQYRRLL